jgi:RNA polymerase sigma factor (sigma-70 family)
MVEPFIRRRARRVARDDHLVDDIVQEVWILLTQRAGCIRDPQALIAWLGVVTVRRGIRLRERHARLVATPFGDDEAGSGSTEDDAVARCSAEEIKIGVDHALDALDDGQRELIELLTFDDRPRYAEISRTVGRPVGSLGPSRQRLLDKLRRDPHIAALQELATAS